MPNVTVVRGRVKIRPVHQQMELSPEVETTKARGPASFYNIYREGNKKAVILDLALRSTMGMIRDPEWEHI